MYFVVGVLALIIAGVYIVMEMVILKKNQAAEAQSASSQPVVNQPVVNDAVAPQADQAAEASVQTDKNESEE
jgi:hypothetical protein